MSRLSVILAAALVALSAVLMLSTLSLRSALRATRDENAQLLTAERAHQQEIADLKKSFGAGRAAHGGTVPAMPARAAAPSKLLGKRSPAEEERDAREARRRMIQMYGQGLAALHLPPEKLAALKRLLTEMNLSGNDLFEAAQAAGVAFDSPAFRDFAEKSHRDNEAEIAALIGNDDWLKLQAAAGESLFQQSVHNSLAYDFQDAGLPLDPSQEEALARAMADAEKTIPPAAPHPPGYFAVDPASGLKPADQAVLAEAASALTPAQQQLLKEDLIMQNRSSPVPGGGDSYISGATTIISMETVETHVIAAEASTETGP